MISLYFGLPGAGKSTLACKLLLKASNKYKNLYCNFPVNIPGVTYIDNECFGKYDLSNSFIVIDEGQLFANNRDYKTFSSDMLTQFVLHRHDRMDIAVFTQASNSVDKKIRDLTCDVYYLYKSFPLGFWVTNYYKIPYKVMIPSAKSGSDRVGEILMGFYEPPFLVKLFSKKLWRPKYYKYFDSFVSIPRRSLPPIYKSFHRLDLNKLSMAFKTSWNEPIFSADISSCLPGTLVP